MCQDTGVKRVGLVACIVAALRGPELSACVSSSESPHAIPAARPNNAGFAPATDRCCTCGCTDLCHLLTEGGTLRNVVERWPELPEYVRQAVVRTLVDATGQAYSANA